MKKVDVEVTIITNLLLDWKCPECKNPTQNLFNVSDVSYLMSEHLECQSCGKKIKIKRPVLKTV